MDTAEEDICRVCRSEGTQDKPLYHPCVCTGSIKFIHQECLLQWLKHSRKEYCELCKHRFAFTPIYSPDMPSRLPVQDIFAGLVTSIGTAIRYWFHYTLVAFAWLGVVPLTACRIYKCLFTGSVSSLLTLPLDMLSTHNLLADCLQGCFVVTCTLCAFISLVWLREQIVHGGAPQWLEQNQPPLVPNQPNAPAPANEGPGGNAAANAQAAADAAAGQNPADPAPGGPAPANPHEAGNQGNEAELDDDEEDEDGEDDDEEEDEEGREDAADANNGGQVKFQRSRRLLGVCYIVVKVSLLVVMEIGLFPLICGWWLDICSLVLRPGVLWFLRNLNDPDFNPVQEMIHLPIYRHLRRFILSVVSQASSCCIRKHFTDITALTFVFALIELELLSTKEIVHMKTCDAPVSELSLELLLLQVVLPALLEQGHTRQWLKRLVHAWTFTAGYMLDLHSYLLGEHEDDDNQPNNNPPGRHNNNNNNRIPGLGEGLHAAHQAILQQGGPVGFQPYHRPINFPLKIILLVVFMCVTLLVASLICLTLPVCVGRWLMSFWMGSAMVHELYTAASGLYMCWLSIRAATVLLSWMPQGRMVIMVKAQEWTFMSPTGPDASLLPLAGVQPEMQTLVDRRIYPFLLMVVILLAILSFQIRQFKRLYEHIKNDKYLVGQRLVNYEPFKSPHFQPQQAAAFSKTAIKIHCYLTNTKQQTDNVNNKLVNIMERLAA
ncbi:hypothetical protein PAMP_004398 [Pampus punctatissimus]